MGVDDLFPLDRKGTPLTLYPRGLRTVVEVANLPRNL